MCDEKWIPYDNNVRERSWSKQGEALQTVAKPRLTPRKVIFSVRACVRACVRVCDWKGIVHYELLPPDQTIDSNLYHQQLEKLRQARESDQNWSIGKASSITTASLHTSLMIRQKLRQLDWEVLIHPPYSPDLASSDYHLFRSLQNSLNGVKLTSKETYEKIICRSFLSRNHRSSTLKGLWFYFKNGRKGRIKRHIFSFINFI